MRINMNIKPVLSSTRRGALYVTDYVEVGTQKMVSPVGTAFAKVGRATRLATCRTKVGVLSHRNAMGDRMVARMIARDERRAAKAKANSDTHVAETDTTS